MLTNRWAGFRKLFLVKHDKERQKEGRARLIGSLGRNRNAFVWRPSSPNPPDAFISN